MRMPTLASLIGLAALATTGACVVRTTPGPAYGYQSQGYVSGGIAVNTPSTYYVESEPPAPLYESISTSPGYGHVWIDGYWHWNGYEWVWVSGRWVRDMEGYVYISPYYDYSGGRYSYHSGYWSRHDRVPPGVIVRDHRDGRPSTGYRPNEHVPVRDPDRDHRPPGRGDVTPPGDPRDHRPPTDPRPTPPPAPQPDPRPTPPRPAPAKPTPPPAPQPDSRPTPPRPAPAKPAKPTPPAPRPDTRPAPPRPAPAKPAHPPAKPATPQPDTRPAPPRPAPNKPAKPTPSAPRPAPAAPKDTKKKGTPPARPHSSMLTGSASLALLVNDGNARLLTNKDVTMDLDLETMPDLKAL